jgi:tape measure domain-containing protein
MRESAIASRVSGQIPLGRGGFPQLPSGTGGALALRGVGGGGGRGTGGGGGVFGRGAGFFGDASGSLNLPGQGVIRELGEEFGFAAKQVLLFGTAYKALAFAQNFPAQVAEAVSQLQSFRNTLAAISPTAQEAVASNSLILSLVERYNIPLQSARDGFTKLYASMQPAGFSGEQIRDLFTGVSKAAATFGMSADKVDRVNYAFAQMASKGQVMSEELKGQLGDVLPGAMAIFAQAAGFKGEQAISKFSAALEDGRYKGSAMIELLNNVTIVLNQKFSRGAEGAAKTFQGAMNNMQTTFKSFYETFEPVAAGFLNGVVTPMMEGVKTITDGLNAFFNGTRAQTAGGFALAQELEKLRPSFDGIKKNATDLIAVFGQFAKIALDLSRVLLEIAGNPIAGYLLKIYAIMVPINMALNVMKGLWALNSIQLLLFNARIATGTATLTAFRGMMAATGATAATTAASIRTAGVTLRTFFATTGVGLVVAGISILIEQFFTLEQKLAAVKEKALGAAQAIRGMSATEARAEEQRSVRAMKILEGLGKRAPLYAGSDRVGLTEPEAQLLESMGIPVPKGLGGGRSLPQTSIAGYQQRIESVNLAESRARQNQIKFEEQQQNRDIQFTEIQGGGGDGGPSRASQAAARAAERAALEAQRLQAVERQLSEELRIRRRTLQIDENIAAARADQDDERMAELESDKRILDIGIRRAKIQKDFDAKRIKAAEYQLRLQLLEIDKIEEQKKYEEDLNKIFKERFGITDPVARAAREAREKSFGFGMGAGAFRTDIDLMPGLTGGILGERREELSKELSALLNPVNQLVEAANNVGKAFGEAFKGMVNGSMTAQQALASFFQSVGDYFLDMASRMIAKWIEMQIIGLAKSLLPGGSTIFPNGVSNFSGAFGPSGPVFQPGAFAANGAVWQGGFTPFANGGVVTGPTLGLVGEGRFNEAIVPLPNGKSIPVELGDGAGSNISTNIVINVGNGQAQSSMTGGGASDLGRKMEGAVKQVIVNELRPGGLLSGGRR